MNFVKPLRKSTFLLVAVAPALILAQPALAHAYIGPSAAVGFVGATFGLLMAIFSAIGVLLLWPARALLKLLRRMLGAAPIEAAPRAADPETGA
jgi:uncharacterized membrane protein